MIGFRTSNEEVSLDMGCQTNFAQWGAFGLQRGLEGRIENVLYFLTVKI